MAMQYGKKPKEEVYQFSSLEQLSKAAKAAFASWENDACAYEKGLRIIFTPVGSLLYDTSVREALTKHGGQLVNEQDND